jgi:membrane protein involved in colicin uptake
MNDRYQGDGPGGQTRKSAARAKPVTQAASSVHIRKKPQTEAEKRAARKAREKEEERRAAERARRRAEKARAEESSDAEKPAAPTQEKPKGFMGKLLSPAPNMPASDEYRTWRKRYWICIGIGIVFVAFSFIAQVYAVVSSTLWMITLGGAYVFIIGAFIIDFRKVRPLIKEHQRQGSGNKSPKQLKHEQEAKERAEAIEAARRAEKEAKKRQRRRKSDDTIVSEDEQ